MIVPRLGRRGSALLAMAVLDVFYGIRLITVDPGGSDFYRWLDAAVPLLFWGVLWLVVAALCLLSAFRPTNDRAGFLAGLLIKILWSALNIIGYLTGEVFDGWMWAVIWTGFAVIIGIITGWAEPISRRGGATWTPPSP